MVLIKVPSSPLKNHTLLILTPFTPPASQLETIRNSYPDLKVVTYDLPWGAPGLPDDFDEAIWKDVTILLTSSYLPAKELVPRLQYVQLTSAGANHLVGKPLFSETDVPFCTANGVHG